MHKARVSGLGGGDDSETVPQALGARVSAFNPGFNHDRDNVPVGVNAAPRPKRCAKGLAFAPTRLSDAMNQVERIISIRLSGTGTALCAALSRCLRVRKVIALAERSMLAGLSSSASEILQPVKASTSQRLLTSRHCHHSRKNSNRCRCRLARFRRYPCEQSYYYPEQSIGSPQLEQPLSHSVAAGGSGPGMVSSEN